MKLADLKNIRLRETEEHMLLAHRRDAGEEWKFWTGVNWFGTKAKACPVTEKEAVKLEAKWSLKAKRIPAPATIKEDALDTNTVEDLWDANKDKSSWYGSTAQYIVRPIKDTNPVQYEAFTVNGDTRKPFGKFTAEKLAKALEPIRAKQTPDAEGFTSYVDPDKVEAFQYKGDPIKVVLGKEGGARLNNGDYVIRSNDGNNFVYSIEKSSTFEASLQKVDES